MITPKRKPPCLPLHPDDKTYNTTVNQIRYKIERVIANIKTYGESCTQATENHYKFSQQPSPPSSDLYSHTPYE